MENLSVHSQGQDFVFMTSFADLQTKFGFSDRNICEKWVLEGFKAVSALPVCMSVKEGAVELQPFFPPNYCMIKIIVSVS